MEYAEQGCQFKTARAHFLCDVFPSVAVAGWNGSDRVGPGDAFSVDPVSSIRTLIMNMSKLVGRCWILFNPFTLKTDQRKNSTKWSIFNLWNAEKQAYSTMWKYCRRGFLWSHIFYCSRVPQYVTHVCSSLLFSTSVPSAFFLMLCHTPIERKNKRWTLPYPPNNAGLCARRIIIRLRVVIL